jgi:hypothetical protein
VDRFFRVVHCMKKVSQEVVLWPIATSSNPPWFPLVVRFLLCSSPSFLLGATIPFPPDFIDLHRVALVLWVLASSSPETH